MKSRVGLVLGGLLVAATLPSLSWAAVSLSVSNATGKPGDTVEVTIAIAIDGGDVVGSFENALGFQPKVRIPAKGTSTTSADCRLAADVEATLNQYKFTPTSCAGDACTGVKVAILGPETGYTVSSPVYICKVAIAADAAGGEYPIALTAAQYAKPNGDKVPIADATGTITVAEDTPVPTATNTPVPNTPTHTVAATNTVPAPTATNTSAVPTRTNTSLPTRTSTPGSAVVAGDDGCQMNAQGNSSALLMLLLPAAFAAFLRRRAR